MHGFTEKVIDLKTDMKALMVHFTWLLYDINITHSLVYYMTLGLKLKIKFKEEEKTETKLSTLYGAMRCSNEIRRCLKYRNQL